LAILLACACWGTSGIFITLVSTVTGVSALALAFWRNLTAFLIFFLGLALLRPDWLRVRRSDLGWLAALGGTLGILHVFWNLGVILNGAAVATVQQAATPAMVAIAAWLVWGEALGWSKILAILLTFAGTVLVSGLDLFGQHQASLLGLLVGLGIPILYALWNLLGKRVRRNQNPFTTLTYAFGFGALVLLPLQFFTPQPFPVPSSGLVWFTALILVSTLVPFTLYTFALGRLPASVAAILAMSEIAFAAIFAYTLLGERLTASQILGAVLVVGGVALLMWHRWQPAETGHLAQGD
jgi:drug/metabolite transporter (DMT)-like permease